jgi:hypothetical protein
VSLKLTRDLRVRDRRSFDEHVQLFAAYSARIAQLPPASWDRLRLRCADLNDHAFRALLRRALLAAKPHELYIPEPARGIPLLRVIAGASRAVQTGLALAFEFAAEFDAPDRRAPDPPPRRTQSTGDSTTDAYIDATFLIWAALASVRRTDPGVAVVVRAAGDAVLRHDWLPRADFNALYAPIEPEIPFADLEPPSSGTRG